MTRWTESRGRAPGLRAGHVRFVHTGVEIEIDWDTPSPTGPPSSSREFHLLGLGLDESPGRAGGSPGAPAGGASPAEPADGGEAPARTAFPSPWKSSPRCAGGTVVSRRPFCPALRAEESGELHRRGIHPPHREGPGLLRAARLPVAWMRPRGSSGRRAG